MEVIAPADLREGYEFEAEVGGQSFLVTVPPGGVEHGQKFMVPYGGEIVRPKTQVPVGAWKDGLCNCFEYGPCHNHLCMSCWCVPRKYSIVSSFGGEPINGSCCCFIVSHHPALLFSYDCSCGRSSHDSIEIDLARKTRIRQWNHWDVSKDSLFYHCLLFGLVPDPLPHFGLRTHVTHFHKIDDPSRHHELLLLFHLCLSPSECQVCFHLCISDSVFIFISTIHTASHLSTADLMFAKSTPFPSMKCALLVMKIAAFLVGVHIWWQLNFCVTLRITTRTIPPAARRLAWPQRHHH